MKADIHRNLLSGFQSFKEYIFKNVKKKLSNFIIKKYIYIYNKSFHPVLRFQLFLGQIYLIKILMTNFSPKYVFSTTLTYHSLVCETWKPISTDFIKTIL